MVTPRRKIHSVVLAMSTHSTANFTILTTSHSSESSKRFLSGPKMRGGALMWHNEPSIRSTTSCPFHAVIPTLRSPPLRLSWHFEPHHEPKIRDQVVLGSLRFNILSADTETAHPLFQAHSSSQPSRKSFLSNFRPSCRWKWRLTLFLLPPQKTAQPHPKKPNRALVQKRELPRMP